jgi:hypothetical protein
MFIATKSDANLNILRINPSRIAPPNCITLTLPLKGSQGNYEFIPLVRSQAKSLWPVLNRTPAHRCRFNGRETVGVFFPAFASAPVQELIISYRSYFWRGAFAMPSSFDRTDGAEMNSDAVRKSRLS